MKLEEVVVHLEAKGKSCLKYGDSKSEMHLGRDILCLIAALKKCREQRDDGQFLDWIEAMDAELLKILRGEHE